MKPAATVLLLASLGLAGACHAATASKSDIQALEDTFSAAVRAGNPVAISALYAANATLLPHGAPAMQGQAAIQSYWVQGVQEIAELALSTQDVQPLGKGYAQEIGNFTVTPKAPGTTPVKGKYVVIWVLQGGNWKILSDIWNTNQEG